MRGASRVATKKQSGGRCQRVGGEGRGRLRRGMTRRPRLPRLEVTPSVGKLSGRWRRGDANEVARGPG
jgi:hypothetical protein